MKKKIKLTPKEEKLMDIFWTENRVLTCLDLKEQCADEGWCEENILNVLRNLKNKGLIEVCGFIQRQTSLARCFQPKMTRAEYAAKVAVDLGIDEKTLGDTAAALVKSFYGDEEVISRLEGIIEELKNRQ